MRIATAQESLRCMSVQCVVLCRILEGKTEIEEEKRNAKREGEGKEGKARPMKEI